MENRNRALIITGGSLNTKLLQNIVNDNEFEQIIAVDGGLSKAYESSVKLDYIIGDFDTVNSELVEWYREQIEKEMMKTVIIQLNPEKDLSDTQAAIELAMEYGAKELLILGATGTRVDHMLANIQLLRMTVENEVDCSIVDEYNKIALLQGKHKFMRDELYGPYVSLLPLTNEVTGITLRGFKYPLQDYTMVLGNSIGISNEAVEEQIEVDVDSGLLLMIQSDDQPKVTLQMRKN